MHFHLPICLFASLHIFLLPFAHLPFSSNFTQKIIMQQFSGTGVAVITPFNNDNSIDFESLKKTIDHLTKGKVEYLVILGTTGESATLSSEEKQQVFSFVAENNGGKLPLVAGIGGNYTQQV